jgi:hypothetical protein
MQVMLSKSDLFQGDIRHHSSQPFAFREVLAAARASLGAPHGPHMDACGTPSPSHAEVRSLPTSDVPLSSVHHWTSARVMLLCYVIPCITAL